MTKNRITDRLSKIPLIGWLAGPLTVAFEFSMYEIAMLINSSGSAAARSVIPKIDAIDGLIPFIPVFIFGYVFSYGFWIVSPVLTSLDSRRNTWNYLLGIAISVIVGFTLLTVFPTRMDRAAEGVIAAANGSGFTAWVLHFIIYADGGAVGINLLPSFHCMLSVSIYCGVAFKKKIPLGWRIFVFCGMALIVVSTLFVKQHYFLDAVAGIGLGLGASLLGSAIDIGSVIENRRRKKDAGEG
ncbi:MAG: phosphatase PAP2 family protein [Clostridia bacterium]|nr:phosphatase PAP2 family protein [Clostridia bacterium]